jgi:hypothetical protein
MWWTVAKVAATNWSGHKDARQGAALAYYSVFSLVRRSHADACDLAFTEAEAMCWQCKQLRDKIAQHSQSGCLLV